MRVDDELLEAPKIFLDVGARAFVPDMPGLETADYLTNSGMMEIDRLPEHLIIIGGSYIGLEFAQMYRRFGSRVTVVEMQDRLISRDDPDVAEAVLNILAQEGVEFRLNAECIAVENREGQCQAQVTGSFFALSADALAAAAVAGLGLVLLPDWNIGYELRQKQLTVVLPGYDAVPKSSSIWAVHSHLRQVPPKIRVFTDFLVEHFKDVTYS